MQGFIGSIMICALMGATAQAAPATDSQPIGNTHLSSLAWPVLDIPADRIAYVEPIQNLGTLTWVKRLSDGQPVMSYLDTTGVRPLTMTLNTQANRLALVDSNHFLRVLDIEAGIEILRLQLDQRQFPFYSDSMASAGVLGRHQRVLISDDGQHIALQLSTYACSYDKPNVLALVDLKSGTIVHRPGGRMTGDIAFSQDSSTLDVFDLCDGESTFWKWSTSDPARISSVAGWTAGVSSIQSAEGSQEYLVEYSREASDWYLRDIARVSASTGELSWTPAEPVYYRPSRKSISPTSAVIANTRAGISQWVGQTEIKLDTYSDFTSLHVSSDWQVVAGYRAYSRKLEVWSLATRAKLAVLDLGTQMPWGSSEALSIDLSAGDERLVTVYFNRRMRASETDRLERWSIRY